MITCPACRSSDISDEIISVKKDYSLSGYKYNKCSKCDSTYLADSSISSQDNLTEIHAKHWYESSNFKFMPEKGLLDRAILAIPNVKTLLDDVIAFDVPMPKQILDVGCGNGEFVYAANYIGISSYGIEPNVKQFDIITHEPALKERLFSASIEDIISISNGCKNSPSFPCGSNDLIILNDVLEHLYDPFKSLVLQL